MTHLLALSVGDSGSLTSIGNLPSGIGPTLNSSNPLNSIIGLLINLIFFVAVLIAFVFAIWGGYKMMVSQGDKKNVEEARTMILNSILGLVIVFLAFLFINTIGYFFHLQLFNTTINVPK